MSEEMDHSMANRIASFKLVLPVKQKGPKTKEYKESLKVFAKTVQKMGKELGKKKSSRGWAYLLEGARLIDKSQIDSAQGYVNECRVEGLVPLDFVLEDVTRKAEFVEEIGKNTMSPEDWLKGQIELNSYMSKTDVGFWQSQEYYIQMTVEKIDVFWTFHDTCKKYHIPLANFKGWTDLHSRGHLIERYKEAEEQYGLKPVLLYFGDHDPAGILIAKQIAKNLHKLHKAMNWDIGNFLFTDETGADHYEHLIIDHFGLHYDFIEENHLVWIDNLITGSGKEASEKLSYVRDYLARFGRRKCEANAIAWVDA